MNILVTGATGAIGAGLVPRLAGAGHRVRAFARDPARVTAAGLSGVVRGNALTGAGLDEALAGIDVAYFLIHSMESRPLPAATAAPGSMESRPLPAPQSTEPRPLPAATAAPDSMESRPPPAPQSTEPLPLPAATANAAAAGFADRDRRAADAFARAARAAGVRRIVYLGGLVPQDGALSPHLASRLEVEEMLLAGAPEGVALRASIVISARSRSFRFLVRLVERVPVMPLPDWRDNRTAPIDGRDVLAYLTAAGTSDAVEEPLSLDIAGPEVMRYGAMIERIRDALLLGRPRVDLPLRLTAVASRVAAAIAGEDPALIEPLMGSLGSDLLPRDERAPALFGVRLHSFDAAVERALRDWEADEELAAR